MSDRTLIEEIEKLKEDALSCSWAPVERIIPICDGVLQMLQQREISVPPEGYDTWQDVLDENRKYEELLQKQMKRESQGANHNEKAAEDIFPTKRESNNIDKAAIIAATRAHMRYMRHTSIGPVSKLLKICIEAYLAALPVRESGKQAYIVLPDNCPKCGDRLIENNRGIECGAQNCDYTKTAGVYDRGYCKCVIGHQTNYIGGEPVCSVCLKPRKEGLGRFRHHPDPAIDFCCEVDFLEGRFRNVQCGMDTKEDVAKEIFMAMQFRVGGDIAAIKAKDRLRDIEARLNSIEDESQK